VPSFPTIWQNRDRPRLPNWTSARKFSWLLIVSVAIKRCRKAGDEGREGSRTSFRRRASHRKFSLREPAENSIGMVWIPVSRDERSARFRNTDASRHRVPRGRKSLVFFISLALAFCNLGSHHPGRILYGEYGKSIGKQVK